MTESIEMLCMTYKGLQKVCGKMELKFILVQKNFLWNSCIVFFIIHIFHELSENPLYREMGILLHCREECKLVELNKGNLALLKMHIGTDPANSRQIHLWYVIFIQTLGNIYKDSRLIFISKDKKQVPQ